MNYGADEQLELLSQLLGNEHVRQDNLHTPYGLREVSKGEHAPQRQYQDSISISDTTSTPLIETRPDAERERRKGVPEFVFAETKDDAQILAMAQGLLTGSGRAILSRMRPESIPVVKEAFRANTVRMREAARAMVIYAPGYVRRSTGGHVGVISAGTSDIPVAEEAALIAEEMGCRVTTIYDVGVAGLHRLVQPLRDLLATEVDVIVVAAGMDGALPSVIAGLVPVPVIGLPTSIGYGMGGKGVAALLSMLQTCAPGLCVVNIDNGVGAGITAALIANRVAQAREHQS